MFDSVAERLVGLRRRYAEPHRAYHNQAHIDAMLAGLRAAVVEQRAALELAVWYHDAIYDPAASDNEVRSAALLEREMAGLADAALVRRAADLVRLTADHRLPEALAADADAALFLDLDMAVLGGDAAAYDAYERGIAAEYIPVHGADRYGAGRVRFLRDLLERPRLFLTEAFHRRCDAAARGNIRRALGVP